MKDPRAFVVVNAPVVRIAEQALSPLETTLKAGAILTADVRRAQPLPQGVLRRGAVEIAQDQRFAVRRPPFLEEVCGRSTRVHRPAVRDFMRKTGGRAEHGLVETRRIVAGNDGVVHPNREAGTMKEAVLDDRQITRRRLRLTEARC